MTLRARPRVGPCLTAWFAVWHNLHERPRPGQDEQVHRNPLGKDKHDE